MEIETPLHPNARKSQGRLLGDAFISMNVNLSQMRDAFCTLQTEIERSDRLWRMQLLSMSMLNKPLSLITLSGV